MNLNMVRVLLLLASLSAWGCDRTSQPPTARGARQIMGTLAEVTAVAADEPTARAAVEAAYDRLADVNRLMSDYRDDSEIGRLNKLLADQPLAVSAETFHVLQESARLSELSGGAFDITCRPVIRLWKAAAKNNQVPVEPALRATMAAVGWRKLELSESDRTVAKSTDATQVDLGGIAKGYSLDLAAEAMREAGATSGLVDVGGDVYAFGRRPDGAAWSIGIRHPFQQGLVGKLRLIDKAVATSGLQQRFFEIDGRRYSHIIDPRTGRPAEQAPCVTVIANNGLTADAWATILSVLTVEDGIAMLANQPEVEALWIWGTKQAPQTKETAGFTTHRAR